MMLHHPPRKELRFGAAATEFAILAPLLIVLALATADFGRAFYFREAISNAARLGAATAASQGFTAASRAAWEANVLSATIAELENLPGFNASDVDFELTVLNETSELFTAAVEVSYPFRNAVSWPALPQNVMIRERVAMQRFR
jgi:Flp pilus assembly protein TadG